VILLRRGGRHNDRGLQVLMLQRGTKARFMPGIWVFAGGVVEESDRSQAEDAAEAEGIEADELAHRFCAARELGEESGLAVDATELLPWSRWITPEQVSMRFDTRFYVGLAPAHSKPQPDMVEMEAARWIGPAEALAEQGEGGFELSFPTVKHLEELRAFASAEEVMENATKRPVVPLTPKVVGTEDSFEIILPGEPGYDEA
jgi:8-oxo-dGTP pyrophosphatase MutT (NUDIX family)